MAPARLQKFGRPILLRNRQALQVVAVSFLLTLHAHLAVASHHAGLHQVFFLGSNGEATCTSSVSWFRPKYCVKMLLANRLLA